MKPVMVESRRALTTTRATIMPHRQIRALHDDETITVYQAYNSTIADAAVRAQKLNASPAFKLTRMTWIKPSWCWMLYRAGYSYKDPGQERILAIRMRHADFVGILERGKLTTHASHQGRKNDEVRGETKGKDVKIQWDPERGPRLDRLEHRSIQIGIPAAVSQDWVDKWIVGIEDVTHVARELKRVLDQIPSITDHELVERGLVPVERAFEVSVELQEALCMA